MHSLGHKSMKRRWNVHGAVGSVDNNAQAAKVVSDGGHGFKNTVRQGNSHRLTKPGTERKNRKGARGAWFCCT